MASSAASRTIDDVYDLTMLTSEITQLKILINEQRQIVEEQKQRVAKEMELKNYCANPWGQDYLGLKVRQDIAKFDRKPPTSEREWQILAKRADEDTAKQELLYTSVVKKLNEYQNQLDLKEQRRATAIASDQAKQKELFSTVQLMAKSFQHLFQETLPKGAPPPYPIDEKKAESSARSTADALNEEVAQLKTQLGLILAAPVVAELCRSIDKIVLLATQSKQDDALVNSGSVRLETLRP